MWETVRRIIYEILGVKGLINRHFIYLFFTIGTRGTLHSRAHKWYVRDLAIETLFSIALILKTKKFHQLHLVYSVHGEYNGLLFWD